MSVNNANNQSYWFVVKEDHSNVILSANHFTIHNQRGDGEEAKYVGNQQFTHIDEISPADTDLVIATEDITETETKHDANNFWDRSKIKLFLTLCLENNFQNPTKDASLLEEIANHIGTTIEDCINKFRNLRRTFIRLLKKKRQGMEIKWVHYNICEKVFSECKSLPNSILDPWDEKKIKMLLELYMQNLGSFRNPNHLQKQVWKEIASRIGTTEFSCYHKFKNLKRTYFNWLRRNRDQRKHVKWPYHKYFEEIYRDYTPAIGPWDNTKIRTLIDAYSEMADKFKDPRYQKKDLWKRISMLVDETPQSCDKKFRNLKQTYLKLKMRAEAGQPITKWRYYKDFDNIYSPNSYWRIVNSAQPEEDYVKQLLQYYIENKHKFRDPMKKKKHVWGLFASKIGLTSEGCDKKFRNLKQTYIRLSETKRMTGKLIRWPYFSYFEKIYDDRDPCCKMYEEDVTMSEVKKVVRQLQDTKDHSKFERLVRAVEESNNIERERNRILQALLDRNT